MFLFCSIILHIHLKFYYFRNFLVKSYILLKWKYNIFIKYLLNILLKIIKSYLLNIFLWTLTVRVENNYWSLWLEFFGKNNRNNYILSNFVLLQYLNIEFIVRKALKGLKPKHKVDMTRSLQSISPTFLDQFFLQLYCRKKC